MFSMSFKWALRTISTSLLGLVVPFKLLASCSLANAYKINVNLHVSVIIITTYQMLESLPDSQRCHNQHFPGQNASIESKSAQNLIIYQRSHFLKTLLRCSGFIGRSVRQRDLRQEMPNKCSLLYLLNLPLAYSAIRQSERSHCTS